MTVITQVCLFLKIRYWRLRLVPTSPGIILSSPTVAITTSSRTISFGTIQPEPLAASGSISHRPLPAVNSAISNMKVMIPKELKGLPRWGETCSSRMLFIPNQPANASGTRNNSQTKPALCR